MMSGSTGQLTVPPGFRFHPTDEELLDYYLRKKVSYEAIDLDVIREVDLNKLEPWELKDKCRIGSGPQNEWYFFSHKDKKYPTGKRTNRATSAGFWKATGRDKAIHHNTIPRKLGLRKTLVFYTGRAPHGQKTDWIMHEYRLDDYQIMISHNNMDHQEEGWVVCRVFKKKNLPRSDYEQDHKDHTTKNEEEDNLNHRAWPKSYNTNNGSSNSFQVNPLQMSYSSTPYSAIDSSMQLPQLFSPEANATTFMSSIPSNNNDHNSNMELQCPLNSLRLTSSSPASAARLLSLNNNNINTGSSSDWYFLDKLLATNPNQPIQLTEYSHHPRYTVDPPPTSSQLVDYVGASTQKSHFDYFGCESDNLKFSK